MHRVIHFEIQAEDPQRAIRFYSSLFGWEFSGWGGPQEYWLIKTGADGEPGINGGLLRRRGTIDGEAVIAYVCTMDVASLDDHVERVQAEGVRSSFRRCRSRASVGSPMPRIPKGTSSG